MDALTPSSDGSPTGSANDVAQMVSRILDRIVVRNVGMLVIQPYFVANSSPPSSTTFNGDKFLGPRRKLVVNESEG